MLKPTKIRRSKKLSKKEKEEQEDLLLLATMTKERVSNAFAVVALCCISPDDAKKRISIDRADEDIENRLNQHTIFLDGKKVWEGWFERFTEEKEIIPKRNKPYKIYETFAAFEEKWYELPDYPFQDDEEFIQDLLNE